MFVFDLYLYLTCTYTCTCICTCTCTCTCICICIVFVFYLYLYLYLYLYFTCIRTCTCICCICICCCCCCCCCWEREFTPSENVHKIHFKLWFINKLCNLRRTSEILIYPHRLDILEQSVHSITLLGIRSSPITRASYQPTHMIFIIYTAHQPTY